MTQYSLLDLSPILQGSDAAQSFRNTVDLARHAEGWGFQRYWLAEHHNMPGIASSATSILIGQVAAATKTIKVGSGGIMLPNHAPLVIAEQFGTLATLFPGRIELGLGRAPGSDQLTARALRRTLQDSAESFPQDVIELRDYFDDATPGQQVQAIPGVGTKVPIWLLGSSLFSARLAAALGMPFAFASHFAPDLLDAALATYRHHFEASPTLSKPHAMVGVNLFAADTDEAGQRLMTSAQQQFLALRRNTPGPLRPPVDSMAGIWHDSERANVERALSCSAVGSPARVRDALGALLARTQADEFMFAGQIYDHAARLHSFEIGAEIARAL
ncbi:LLM class flavin-dependent oxidoreductase [Robbsia sp. Bb-Pol-6]|uniref:LLM class flavin-dependent oxidoreductase n=1 Tax=Robbsia betulipollinis TaxID=2981849 RepID=A0ABT3ZHE2_9BURK|nr:LLM class flavin-dependent oxidoreductase [Robbsia betulipollinis]MCY0385945.1 LLM class flavin-dependent oxidoreductase [Robbsia betulipollinis]